MGSAAAAACMWRKRQGSIHTLLSPNQVPYIFTRMPLAWKKTLREKKEIRAMVAGHALAPGQSSGLNGVFCLLGGAIHVSWEGGGVGEFADRGASAAAKQGGAGKAGVGRAPGRPALGTHTGARHPRVPGCYARQPEAAGRREQRNGKEQPSAHQHALDHHAQHGGTRQRANDAARRAHCALLLHQRHRLRGAGNGGRRRGSVSGRQAHPNRGRGAPRVPAALLAVQPMHRLLRKQAAQRVFAAQNASRLAQPRSPLACPQRRPAWQALLAAPGWPHPW